MFDKKVYIRRREVLATKMATVADEGKRGIILFIGNVEAPAQYKDNCYKFRQDSTWLYYFGIDKPCYAAIMDLDSGETKVYANDVDIDDIIWMGPQPSVASIAEKAGVEQTANYDAFKAEAAKAIAAKRKVHFIPPSRYYNTLVLSELFGVNAAQLQPSEALIKAIISMRLVKEECEIAQIDDACELGYLMHTEARNNLKVGIMEQEIVGKMEGVTLSKGWGVSFTTILSQHGETLHNHIHDKIIVPDKLLVIDAGAENNMHYASDFTRTLPTGGKFTPRQKDIYDIVASANNYAFSLTKPGVTYYDVHIEVCRHMLEALKSLDLVRGNVDDMNKEGVMGLFMPHGLGHNMGLDVHDMEDFGEDLVGYDDNQKRSPMLGLGSLRMARKLVPGNVITDEPGIYFVPALIDKWKKEGKGAEFVNFAKLEEYYDFGGIRLEDDVLVTEDGARRTGPKRLPITSEEVEDAMR